MLYRFGEEDLNFGGWLFNRKSKSKRKSRKRRKSKKSKRKSRKRRSFGKKRSRGKVRRSVRKVGGKTVTMTVVDPYEGLVKIQGKVVKLPMTLLDELQDTAGSIIESGERIKILDPVNGVFMVAGEIIDVPFNLSKSVLKGSQLKSTKRSKRKRSKRKRRRRRFSSFGAFGGGRPSTLLGMEGPYMAM
jgi:hypothetical protein